MTAPEPLLETRDAAEAVGIPESAIWSWKNRRKLTPAGLVRGRGRGGLVPLYRLSDLRPLAEAYLARKADERMPTMTLSEFLLARIAEDEAVARSADERARTPWRATYGRQVETSRDGYLVTPEDEHSYTTDPPDEVALHIARHDPARVLAGCEAKRRIVAAHPHQDTTEWDSGLWCHTCQWDICCDQPATNAGHEGTYPCATLRALAAVYAGHPDYLKEWAPPDAPTPDSTD